jgi:acyl-coenzyme A synthetase/AMP-(fatty) acid ligase
MLQSEISLWCEIKRVAPLAGRFLADCERRLQLQELDGRTFLKNDCEDFRNKSVILHMTGPMATALALIELDGLARRLILCPPDMTRAQLADAIADTQPDLLLTDDVEFVGLPNLPVAHGSLALRDAPISPVRDVVSQWLLFTSGTTGRPKAVIHDLTSLTAPLRTAPVMPDAVWSTFYDIRRYGGLTIFLRALLGGASMVFSQASEAVSAFLHRAAADGVTHISGTPSHWRQAMMSGATAFFHPRYVRLSGEPADQAVLDTLTSAFPTATVSHAYASTEAGVAFDIRDGLAGFPAAILEGGDGGLDFMIKDGTLRIRSPRTATRYVRDDLALHDDTGFVDTGDLVERRGDRYFFIGRREGLINVGGLKVHPEEVEAVINQHPAVSMSLVKGRKNPITGALVVADVVLRPLDASAAGNRDAIIAEILAACREALPAYKVPSRIDNVVSLPLTPAGKLLRTHG